MGESGNANQATQCRRGDAERPTGFQEFGQKLLNRRMFRSICSVCINQDIDIKQKHGWPL